MDYQKKYNKYKIKYLELKKELIDQGYDVDVLINSKKSYEPSRELKRIQLTGEKRRMNNSIVQSGENISEINLKDKEILRVIDKEKKKLQEKINYIKDKIKILQGEKKDTDDLKKIKNVLQRLNKLKITKLNFITISTLLFDYGLHTVDDIIGILDYLDSNPEDFNLIQKSDNIYELKSTILKQLELADSMCYTDKKTTTELLRENNLTTFMDMKSDEFIKSCY
jgi:hypothetical protein